MFIGLGNYREVFTSVDVALVAKNTLWWWPQRGWRVSVFLMASLLNTRIMGRSVFRAIFLSIHRACRGHRHGVAVLAQCPYGAITLP